MNDEINRKLKRHKLTVDVTINMHDISMTAVTTDISANGIGIESLKNISSDTQVNIHMETPEIVVFYGTLMWSRHMLINNLDAYQLGFEVYGIMYQGDLYDEFDDRDRIVQNILYNLSK